ncbi:hypothetical protein [Pseudomonas sp. CFBP 13719]|uniref:hypothetical protein n=1 Tax=Pseudomonas sp. CFBP 13719 TaxID=2775303 RepID=UPI00177EB94F|nr:hypothetical protein [Pseudomonas sp. CFBP 13719]MBD8682832.1 hypothetical protein [Pseudomonas sp. CFBP 13719]
MDFVVFLAALIVWGVVWVQLYRMYRRRAWGWVVSQLVSGTLGTVAAFFVVVLALGLINAPPAGEVEDVSMPPVVEAISEGTRSELPPASTPPASKTFGFNDERYLERLEQALKTVDHTRPVEARPVKEGEVNNSRSIVLSPVVSITLGLDKHTGNVNAVTVIGVGNGTDASGIEILIQASAALSAAVPDASVGEVMKHMPSLLGGKPVRFGNVRLSTMKMEALGTWFLAEPV